MADDRDPVAMALERKPDNARLHVNVINKATGERVLKPFRELQVGDLFRFALWDGTEMDPQLGEGEHIASPIYGVCETMPHLFDQRVAEITGGALDPAMTFGCEVVWIHEMDARKLCNALGFDPARGSA